MTSPSPEAPAADAQTLTPEQRQALDELATANAAMIRLDAETALARDAINRTRAAKVLQLRDLGLSMERIGELVGIHFTNLYRIPGVRKARRG